MGLYFKKPEEGVSIEENSLIAHYACIIVISYIYNEGLYDAYVAEFF